MAEDSVLNNISSEFRLWGVKFQHQRSNGGHIELSWQASPDKPVRKTYIPHTGSDWRGWLNQRAVIRRMFKQDGLKDPRDRIAEARNEPLLKKALAMPPPPPEKLDDQVKCMRAEIADLTEFVLEMAGTLSTLADFVKERLTPAPAPVEAAISVAKVADVLFKPGVVPHPVPLPGRRPNSRSQKVMDYLSTNWNSIEAICRDMNLEKVIVKRKLVYLSKLGKVEMQGSLWRKTPPPMPKKPKGKAPPLAVAKKRNGVARANGHHH